MRAVNSVLAQSNRHWELIVIDDGSTDQGPALVAAVTDARVRLQRQTNQGVSRARNAGLEMARGEYVAFLDSDDYWEPAHLANLAALTVKYPDATLYGAAYFTIDGANKRALCPASAGMAEAGLMADYFACAIKFGPPLFTSSVLVSRQRLLDLGGFPAEVTAGEDLLTWARLACVGSVAYSPQPTATYFLPLVAAKVRDQHLRRPQFPDVVANELKELSRSMLPLSAGVRRYLAAWHRMRAMLFLELNEREAAVRETIHAIDNTGPTYRDLALAGLWLLPATLRRHAVAKVRKLRGRE